MSFRGNILHINWHFCILSCSSLARLSISSSATYQQWFCSSRRHGWRYQKSESVNLRRPNEKGQKNKRWSTNPVQRKRNFEKHEPLSLPKKIQWQVMNVIVITTNGTYPWLFVTQLFHKLTNHCGHRKTYEEMTST